MAPPQITTRLVPITHVAPDRPDEPFTVCTVQLQLTVFGPNCMWLSVSLLEGADDRAPSVLGAITTAISMPFPPFVSTTVLCDGSEPLGGAAMVEHADGGWDAKDSAISPQQQFASSLGQRIVKKYKERKLMVTVTCGVQGPLAPMLIGDGVTAPKGSILEFSGAVYRESCQLLEKALSSA